MSSRWYVSGEGWKGHDKMTDPGIVDGEDMWNVPDKYDIKDALDDIAKKITVHDSLFITIIAHGGNYGQDAGFFVVRAGVSDSDAEDNPSSQKAIINCDYSRSGNLGTYLNEHFGGNNEVPRKYAVMTIVIQSCDSGSLSSNLVGNQRIIITATRWNETAWTETDSGENHWAFLYEGCTLIDLSPYTYPGFIKSMGSLRNPESVYYMYYEGNISARSNYAYDPTYPGTYSVHISFPTIKGETLAGKVYL